MTGYDYEHAVAAYLLRNGFHDVEVTKASGDYGVDIIAEKDFLKYAVQCKYYSNPVGIAAVQEVAAGRSMYGCTVAMVVTNSTFTPAAENLAKANGVVLMSGIAGVPETIETSDEQPETSPDITDTPPVLDADSNLAVSQTSSASENVHSENYAHTKSFSNSNFSYSFRNRYVFHTYKDNSDYHNFRLYRARHHRHFHLPYSISSFLSKIKIAFCGIHLVLCAVVLSIVYDSLKKEPFLINFVILIPFCLLFISFPFWVQRIWKWLTYNATDFIGYLNYKREHELFTHPRNFYIVDKRRSQFAYEQTENHQGKLDISPIIGLPSKFCLNDVSYNLDNFDDIKNFPLEGAAFYINDQQYHFNDYFRLCAEYYKDAGYINHVIALRKKAEDLERDIIVGKRLKRAGRFLIKAPQ